MKASAVAFSVKGAIGRYLHCCLKVLGNFAEGTLFCPEHYSYEPERYKLGKFSAYLSRWKPCLRLLNLSKVREGACVIVRSGLDAVCLFNGENSSWSGALFFKIQKSSISLVTTIHGVQAYWMKLCVLIGAFLRRGVIAINISFRRSISEFYQRCFSFLFLKHEGKELLLRETFTSFGCIVTYKLIGLFLETSRFLYTIAGSRTFSRMER